ncbi:MAG TPA: hypothetical protein VGP72_33470 [Planctomycetota bacterium]|jgi:hypothetical protein
MTPLRELDLPWKVLLSSVLLVMLFGFAAAEHQVWHVVATADGKPGLSLNDITCRFYGDRSSSVLKREILGGMKRYFSSFENPRELTPADQADLQQVLAWLNSGAPESGYWDPLLREKQPAGVYTILSNHGCFGCHAPNATSIGNKKDSPLNTYASIRRFTEPDKGMDTGRLLSLSHTHLFGMSMLFLLLGAAIAATQWHTVLRCVLVASGPLGTLLTVLGWWGVKWDGAAYAPVVFAGGVVIAAAFLVSVAAVSVDMWRRREIKL